MNTKSRIFTLIFAIILTASIAGTINVKADEITVTVTRTFSALSYDGFIKNSSETYSEVWNAQEGEISDGGVALRIGQLYSSSSYFIYRAFLFFDTSIIPDDATIINATLSIHIQTDASTADFNVTVQNGQPTYPHIPLQANDFYKGHYSGNGGSRNTAEAPSSGYWNITLNENGLSWIQKAGTTKLCLRSSRDINGIQPSNLEFLMIYTAEKGDAYAPKLYVTYETQGYRLILHGPYYENGEVADMAVNVAVEVPGVGVETYTLDGSDGAADTLTLDYERPALSVSWNASTIYLNTTRMIHVRQDLTFEELWIYVPDLSSEAADYYTFNVLDMVGLEWGYLEICQTVTGQYRVIERRDIKQSYTISFFLVLGRTYDIRLITNLGTYNYGIFTAAADRKSSIIISYDMFPSVIEGLNINVTVWRPNATWIKGYYIDGNASTLWVEWTVKHKQGSNWIIDFSVNNTGNSQIFNWLDADNETDYLLTITAQRTDRQYIWSYMLPAPKLAIDNPWQELDNILGYFGPIPARYILGIFLILLMLGIFSYANIIAGLFSGWATAALLTYINWLPLPWPLLGACLFIIILEAVYQARKGGKIEV